MARRDFQEQFFRRVNRGDTTSPGFESWAMALAFAADELLRRVAPWSVTYTEEMQQLADTLDYGPQECSPRLLEQVESIKAAFDSAVAEQTEKCSRGDHLWGAKGTRCRHCKKARFEVVE